MKRRLFFFILILAAALCVSAVSFATELTWNQVCTKKTSSATRLYVEVEGESGLIESGMLPAGTYLRTTGETREGKTGITYSVNQRDPLYGFISGSVIVSAAQTITLPSGKKVTVSEALVRSRTALNLYLEMEYGESYGNSPTYTDGNGKTHAIGNEAALEDEGKINGDMAYFSGLTAAYAANGGYTKTFYTDDEGNRTEVEVRYMGLARSMIVKDGEAQLAETWRLDWESKAPEDRVLAVVNPPKGTGTVRLYAKSSTKSLLLFHVQTNRVVRVISAGSRWALVDIDNDECPRGYIRTQYLDFYPNIPMAYRSAKVSVNGYTKGKDTVYIRSSDNASAGHIEEYKLGTQMSVYAQNSKWSEVDIGGYHAFILSKYVTFDEEPAEPAGEPEAADPEEPEDPEEETGRDEAVG